MKDTVKILGMMLLGLTALAAIIISPLAGLWAGLAGFLLAALLIGGFWYIELAQ